MGMKHNAKHNIKVAIETITPEQALYDLTKKNPRNRKRSESYNARLAADIKRGHFIINGETIIYDVDDMILDGQGRLSACHAAGVPIQTIVVRNVPRFYQNGSNVLTQDTIDRGRSRTVADQLQMGHGYKNARTIAAAVRAIAQFLTGRSDLGVSTLQAVDILRLTGKHMEAVIDLMPYAGQRAAHVVAPFTLFRAAERERADDFVDKYVRLENLPPRHPALMLHHWLKNNPGRNTHARRLYTMRIVCCALLHFTNGTVVSRLSASDVAYNWLLAKHKTNARKVSEIIFGN